VETVLREHPALRDAVFRYFEALGASRQRLKVILTYLLGGHCVDDASFFACCVLLVNWSFKAQGRDRALIRRNVLSIEPLCRSARFGGVLFVLVKYLPPRSLGAFVRRHEADWSRSPWASRQVAAVLGVLPVSQEVYVRRVLLRHGLADALLVTEHVKSLMALKSLDMQLRAYLMHRGRDDYAYPLQKVVLARTLLGGSLEPSAKRQLKKWLVAHVSDPVYRESIQRAR
jgi:hypothetical protein